mmetsp:Transcript_60206/g.143502  ORF Transcript_60206/g.143502 Transcript_60206/m.143502 type:complete len:216 (-) Transcript_60206:11-658(-)
MARPCGVVSFNVGGEVFEMLEDMVRAKPNALLCTLLDDPGYRERSEPIFVAADPKLFRYILAWYRFGSICLPSAISMEEMQRECAFYQLPDNVKMSRERPTAASAITTAVEGIEAVRRKAIQDAEEAGLRAFAAVGFRELVNNSSLMSTGRASVNYDQIKKAIQEYDYAFWPEPMLPLMNAQAEQHGWEVVSGNGCSYTMQRKSTGRGMPMTELL